MKKLRNLAAGGGIAALSATLATALATPPAETENRRHVLAGPDLAAQFESIAEPCGKSDGGCAVDIEPGTYEIDRPIHLCNAQVDARGVKILARETSGLVAHRTFQGTPCHRGVWSWRGGTFRGVGTSTTTRPLPVGIDIRSRGILENVSVGSFVRGLQMVCPTSKKEIAQEHSIGFTSVTKKAHCNLTQVVNSTFSSNWLDGIYVRGADANAGSFRGINSFVNCRRAYDLVGAPEDYDKPYSTPTGMSCANFHERSFLGNTYVAPHSAHSVDQLSKSSGSTWKREDGAQVRWRYYQYLTNSRNGRNVFLGAYTENDRTDSKTGRSTGNGPSELKGYGHHVYGGLNQIDVESGSLRISEWGHFSHLRTSGRSKSGARYRVDLGTAGTLPMRLQLKYSDGTKRSFSLQHFDSGWLEIEAGRATGQRSMAFWMKDDETHPLGSIRLYKPLIRDPQPETETRIQP